MMDVVPFTRCRNFECARCLPVEPGQTSIECWACGEKHPVAACSNPWPAARRCVECKKTIPYGPEAARLRCPWCRKSVAADAVLASKDLAAQELDVLGPIAATVGVEKLVSTRMLVRCKGYLVWTCATCQGASNQAGFDIWVECPEMPAMRFVSEGASHKIGKSLKLMKEVQTGDEPFDRDVFIRSQAPAEDIRAFLAKEHIRAAIRSLLTSGFHSVYTERVRSIVNLDRHGPHILGASCHNEDATPEHWEWAIKAMVGIAQRVSKAAPS
jgi:hypothetical protein